jgi:hypothetical protein
MDVTVIVVAFEELLVEVDLLVLALEGKVVEIVISGIRHLWSHISISIPSPSLFPRLVLGRLPSHRAFHC